MQEKQLEKYNDGKMEIKIKPEKLFLEKNIKSIGKYKSRKIESRETWILDKKSWEKDLVCYRKNGISGKKYLETKSKWYMQFQENHTGGGKINNLFQWKNSLFENRLFLDYFEIDYF